MTDYLSHATTACIKRPGGLWTSCPCPACSAHTLRMHKLARCGRVPAPPRDAAVARVVEWVSQGFSPAWIASVIGTSRATVPEIAVAAAGGRPYRMTWATSRAIMHADITAATEGWRDATGTRRRLQALAWLGYPQALIANMTGLPPATVAIIARGQQRHVTPQQWRSISAAYELVGDRRGPSTAAHSRAVTRGWLPPATWDDPDTDAQPTSTTTRKESAA